MHSMQYGVFKDLMEVIRKMMGKAAPFIRIDQTFLPNIRRTSEFNRDLKPVINKKGQNTLPSHTMEDVANVIEVTLPLILATDTNGR